MVVGAWQLLEMWVASASCDATLILVEWLPVNMICDLRWLWFKLSSYMFVDYEKVSHGRVHSCIFIMSPA